MVIKTESEADLHLLKVTTIRSDAFALNILIWTQTKADADDVDQILKPLLVEYGYDPEAPEVRREFKGTHFIGYKFSRRTPDFEEDIEIVLTDEPPQDQPQKKDLSPKKSELLERLKKKLEVLNGVLIVGALLFTGVTGATELSKKAAEMFHAIRPAATATPPAPAPAQITIINLPPSFTPLVDLAEKDPKKFEEMMSITVETQLMMKERERLRKNKKSKPESPPTDPHRSEP
jgi:hypothetical protein